MKKTTLLLLFTLAFIGIKAQTTYQLNYDSVRVGKTDNSSGIALYGDVYFKGTIPGLLKLNADRKFVTTTLGIGDVTGLQDSLTNKYSKSDVNARLSLKVDSLLIETITPTIGGEPTRIAYKVGSNATAGFPLVIYFHGDGEDQNDCFTNTDEKRVTDYLLQHGYMVASSNGGGSLWGNQTAQNAYKALYDYCIAAYPGISKVIFIGQSMGAMTSLNLIASGTVDVDAWYGIYPATNLAYAYSNGFASRIETAYGFSGSGGYAAATAGFDPNLKLKADYPNIWYRMTASYDDTVIPRANNSDLFQAKLADANAIESFIVTHTGDHGDPSAFIPYDVDWFTKTQYNTNVVGDRFISKSTEGFKFSNSSDGTVLSAYDGSGRTRAWQIDKISNGFKIYIDGASEYVFSITNLGIPSFSKRLTTAGFTSTAGALFTGLSSDSYFDATYANTLNFGYNTNGNESSWINFRGYQGGTTQYRDFSIGNGKGAAIVNFIGSTGVADFANSPTVPTPTAGTDAANKAYVDAAVSGGATFSRDAINDTNAAYGTFPTANTTKLVAFTAMTGNRTVDIPAGNATNASTNIVIVKDESGSGGTYTITITPASGTIDGAASKVVNTAYGFLELYSNGSNWFTK